MALPDELHPCEHRGWGTTRIHGESQSLAQWDAQSKAEASASTFRTAKWQNECSIQNQNDHWWHIDDILMTYWWHFDTISIQSDLQKAIITTSCRSSWIDPWYIQSQLLEYHLQLVITSGASAWASASTSNLSLFGAVSCMKMRTCSSQNHRRSPWYWVVMHV